MNITAKHGNKIAGRNFFSYVVFLNSLIHIMPRWLIEESDIFQEYIHKVSHGHINHGVEQIGKEMEMAGTIKSTCYSICLA